MLALPEIVAYLLEHKLIQEQAIVEGDLTIVETSRRNRNMMVARDHGPSYFLKEGVDRERAATLANEARVYEFLQAIRGPVGTRLNRYLPKFYGYDPTNRILFLALVPGGQDFGAYLAQHGYFSISLARALGNALGTVHYQTKIERLGNSIRHRFWDRPPWILSSFYRPTLGIYQTMSGANTHLLKILQQFPQLRHFLDELREEWQGITLIHGDIKWDNCIAFSQSTSGRKTRIKIVDWELSQIGDPCWDIGSVFCAFLWSWLNSIPIAGEEPPEQFIEVARYPLEIMHPAISAFWSAYVRRMQLDALTAEHWIQRAVRYGAARLIQSAYEQMQNSIQLTGTIIYTLQLSMNMLNHPKEAATFLLGL